MRTIVMLCAVLLLTGCAPATMSGVRKDHSREYTFTVPMPYDAAYHKVLEHAQSCFAHFIGLGMRLEVAHEFFTDTRDAHIAVQMHNWGTVNTYLLVDLNGIGADKTSVSVYNTLGGWAHPANAVSWWLLKHEPRCRADHVASWHADNY